MTENSPKIKISLKWKADQFETVFCREYRGKKRQRSRLIEYRRDKEERNALYEVFNKSLIYVFKIDIKFYIGKTTNWSKRLSRHWYRLLTPSDNGFNYPLYKAIRENGGKFEIFETISIIHSRYELNNLESLTYQRYKDLYGREKLLNRQEPKLKG